MRGYSYSSQKRELPRQKKKPLSFLTGKFHTIFCSSRAEQVYPRGGSCYKEGRKRLQKQTNIRQNSKVGRKPEQVQTRSRSEGKKKNRFGGKAKALEVEDRQGAGGRGKKTHCMISKNQS